MHAQVDHVQAAAEAAAQALGGDLDGPAAAAARRAAASGLAASREGFKGLGGASQHMAALRELVALPLQASPNLSCICPVVCAALHHDYFRLGCGKCAASCSSSCLAVNISATAHPASMPGMEGPALLACMSRRFCKTR